MRQRRVWKRKVRYARSLWWLSATLGVLAACGDDDDSVRVRVLDGGVDASGIADAGTDAKKPLETDPEVKPLPNPFWHIEHPPDSKRTWMVSPTGVRTFVLGVDSVFREDECAGMPAYAHRAAEAASTEWRRLTDTFHFNAIGAFSKIDLPDVSYSTVISVEPQGDDRALRDATGKVLVNGRAGVKIGDPYNPAFQNDLRTALATVNANKDDTRLQIIYLGHENGIFDIAGAAGGIRDFRPWIWSNCPAISSLQKPRCAPHALQQSLATTYSNIAALNTAWGTSFASFESITKPAASCNATCGSDLLHFVRDALLPTWVDVVVTTARAYAPKHVFATPRLALGESTSFHFFSSADTWADDGTSIGSYDPYPLLSKFDLVALDLDSTEAPWLGDGLHRLQADAQLPAVISELGAQTNITGWSNQGGFGAPAVVASQEARGERYASQLTQLAAFPDVVGVVLHTWSDRYVAADPKRQANVGLVQCDDAAHGFVAGAAWPEFVGGVATGNQSVRKIE